MLQNRAVEKEFDNRGMTLSDEKMAELEEEAKLAFDEAYEYYLSMAAGDTDEVRAKQTEYDMYRDGYILEHIKSELISAAKYDMLVEAARGEVTEISEEELKADYENRVVEDEDTYNYDYAAFESAMMEEGTVVTWMPEGYRTVKHILIMPEDEVLDAVAEARDAYAAAEENLIALEEELAEVNDDDAEDSDAEQRTAEEIQADIDAANAELASLKTAVEEAEAACIASEQETVDAIYAALEAGEDFNALIETYGEDPGMQNEPTMSRGYYVSADSESWDQNFTDGAMLLENIGDVSATPVVGTSGLHIIRYESDVLAGAVAFEEIRDELADSALETARDEYAATLLEQWNAAINPQYDLSKFVVDMAMYGY
jgi:hypothetical protein